MFHHEFINYQQAEKNNRLNEMQKLQEQYLEQLLVLKQTVDDCKSIVHQKYNLTDASVKDFFQIKNDLLKK